MNAKTKKLHDDAISAINKLNGDTSVSKGVTLEALTSVREHLSMLIDAIENDDDADDSDLEMA